MSEKYKFSNPDGMYFTTTTVVKWIDLFTRKEFKELIVRSLQFCQKEKGLVIHTWCLMPSHLHLIVSSEKESLSSIFRDFKKFTSKEIIKRIDEIHESRREWLLEAFVDSGLSLNRVKNFKIWQDGNRPKELYTNKFTEQKLEYLHQNPVEDLIVVNQEDYLLSSSRDYAGIKGLIDVSIIE